MTHDPSSTLAFAPPRQARNCAVGEAGAGGGLRVMGEGRQMQDLFIGVSWYGAVTAWYGAVTVHLLVPAADR